MSTPTPHAFPGRLGLRLALVYTALFLPFGVATPYLQLLLESLGYDKLEVGILQGTLEVMAIIAPPLWGLLADRTERPRIVLATCAALSVPVFFGFRLAENLPVALGVALLFGFLYRPIIPLTTGLTFRIIRERGGDYGRVRIFGSVAFVLPILLLELWGLGGSVDPQTTATRILGAFTLLGLLFAGSVFLLPRDRKRPTGEARPRLDLSVFTSRPFLLVLACAFLGRLAMNSYYQFFTLFLKERILHPQAGLVWMIGPLAEIPVIFYSRRLIDRFGVRHLFLVALAATALRIFGLSIADGLLIIIPLQMLHALTFGAYHIASATYVSNLVPHNLQNSAQTVLAAVSMGLSGISGGALGGWLARDFGYETLFTVFGCFGLAGFLLGLIALPKTDQALTRP